MKKIVFILALLPCITSAQKTPVKANQTEKGFVITGEIEGLTPGAPVKLINGNTNAELATTTVVEKTMTVKSKGKVTTVKKNVFVLKGILQEPELGLLYVDEQPPFTVYIDNTSITITGKKGEAAKWVVKGSAPHNDFKDFETTFSPLAAKLNQTASTINTMPAGKARDSLMIIYQGVQQNIQQKVNEFIDLKAASYVSPFVLLVMMNFNNDPILAETRFNKLSGPVRESYLGKMLSTRIQESKIGAIGTEALDFTQADTAGNNVSLSSFRGKYVLLDFWASWCGPCRDENPTVVYNYNKFRDKNFTVLGVSLDRPGKKLDWIQAIKEDNLTWTQVSDLQFWNNAAAVLYHVKGIPQNFLIDPNGKIIGKNLRGPDLEAKLCEVLGCN